MRLQHLRKDAGLTGKELSARCGWHPAKTTRIQKGDAAPSDTDIRTWCSACGADDQADDLIATARVVDSMYLEWRRLHQGGMRKVQQDWNTLHERTRVCRVYVSNVPPGFFQTPGFATALMEQITAFQGTPNDVAEAVAASPAPGSSTRAATATSCSWRNPSCASAPPILTPCAGSCATSWPVMPLASVSLGIIPFTAQRTVWPLEAFYLHDDVQAVVETLTAEIKVKQPRELADYAKAFAGLAEMAVYGEPARTLIQAAIDALE